MSEIVEGPRKPSIIAISGKSGCGNSTVSRLVTERLGRQLVNYTFHTMADEMGVPFAKLLEMAKADPSYDRRLDERQVEMAHRGDCVIGSRLAIWLVRDAELKVYLLASSDVRARRIQQREGGEYADVLAFTKRRDESDRERYLSIYGIDNDRYDFADLVINTERLSAERIADVVIAAIGRGPERA
ncbi:MAG TPA: cytidylate kinase family protein [Spirochaetia bacterium]|nr:cytidylate kinase family protein [Spirochaetaceae bacterium]HPE88362.1 cytidylate kinase family protein [Spirochaetales bacterium]HRW23397.1 cytidylate kinase family protein [Spirochaetia bacterium]